MKLNFFEIPHIASLFISRQTFRLRLYHRGYMVVCLTLWDTDDTSMLWWSKPNGVRHNKGTALKVTRVI